MEKSKRPSIFEVNLLYLFLAITFINIGPIVQKMDEIMGLLFTEYIIILLPSLLFILIRKIPMKKFLRLNKISFKQVLLVIIISLFTYPLAVFAQGVFLLILDSFSQFVPNQIPAPVGAQGLIYGLFTMSISAGICEEVMFRGLIMGAYDKLGYKKSILITALLFGIFHFTLVNFIGPLILGIIFGIMVHKTKSLYSSIIAHATNNAIAVGILYFLNKYSSLINDMVLEEPKPASSGSELILVFIIMAFLSLSYIIVKKALASLGDIEKNENIKDLGEIEVYKEENNYIKYLPLTIVVIMFFYINFKYIISFA